MSSERFRERLLSAEPAVPAGPPTVAPGPQPAAASPVIGPPAVDGPPSPDSPPAAAQERRHAQVSIPARHQLQRMIADTPLPPTARWQPKNWRLRTKLVALTVVPLVLAVVLGALRIADAAKDSHAAAVRDAVIIGVFVLLALLLLAMLARSILQPLRALRASAFDVADRRLPGVIELLRTPEGRASDVKIDPVPVYSREDVGQVARAFDAVHSEAVRLASEQAALRANVNDMFVNLSRRSQSLVERQLRLIDELELGEQDSDRLAALFRLDHLATRMRRNGENLLVLAGAELRRRSGEPVPIADVLRAAVSEIEDYRRVVMQPLPRAQVSGLAVNDVVHLVAEVLDNATAYSDPDAQVLMSAEIPEEGGLVIEITDAGTGLPRMRVLEINDRLAAPPAVDVSVARQMGLFVVGRLANRHNIAVQLSSQEGAGVTVTITLPKDLVAPASGAHVDDTANAPLPQEQAPMNGASFGGPAPAPAEQTALTDALVGPLLESIPEPDDAATPIFQAMLSRWFTEPHLEPAAPAHDGAFAGMADTPSADEWHSEADAGWQAAEATEVVGEPAAHELTAAGLPKRRPQAFLVPGSAGSAMTNGQPAVAAPRSAHAVRDRLSSYQRGLSRGRHAGQGPPPGEQAAPAGNRDENVREAHT